MKDLIIDDLNKAFEDVSKREYTKNEKVSFCVEGIDPYALVNFLTENNIPKDCYFSQDDDGRVTIAYDKKVNMNDVEILAVKKRLFENFAWSEIYKSLIANGYVRISVSSDAFKDFKDKSIYEMYIDKDFDSLVKYYSMRFKKNQD
jgi:hypothetical protein